jgi:selenide,water dikinase
MSEQTIRLTQYSHGAGCGCKISPKVLETILHSEQAKFVDPNLLVGNETRDDAAVYDLGNGTSIISTTDFFMPIVDNPFDFGRIAATNAISDIFAMGGKPIMAIAILGWPINTIPPEVAREVIDGGRFACQQAGIALAGGHSIDAPEPIFGLAVTGVVPTERVKRNSTAQAGCKLFLTKPLGIGVLTTEKKSLLKPEHKGLATEVMCQMNLAGAAFANIDGVKAMTDDRFWSAGAPLRSVSGRGRAGAGLVSGRAEAAGRGRVYCSGRGPGRYPAQLRQLRSPDGRNA